MDGILFPLKSNSLDMNAFVKEADFSINSRVNRIPILPGSLDIILSQSRISQNSRCKWNMDELRQLEAELLQMEVQLL